MEKSPAFLKVLAEVNKEYPNRLRQATGKSDTRRIRTGIFQLDRILGGGLPVNRLNLICGHKGSFKTTVSLKAVKNILDLCGDCFLAAEKCQCSSFNKNTVCVFIDTEQAMDEGYITRLGIDPGRVYIFQPPHGEAACEYAEKFAKVEEVRAIVVDSLAALVPLKEISADSYLDGLARGTRALLIARMCRALIIHINSQIPRLAIMLNHLLPLVGGQGGEYLPGGKEQEYLSSVVVKFWTGGKSKNKISADEELKLEDDDDLRKQDVGFLIKNSKVSRDNISGEFALFTKGDAESNVTYGDSDDWEAVTDWGVKFGLLSKVGKTIIIDNQPYGPRQIVDYWKQHPDHYTRVQGEIIAYEKSAQ